MLPPWIVEPLAALVAHEDRLPHALLLHGQRGIGKLTLAKALARTLLCESVANRRAGGCGACASCLWFDARNHPDYRFLTSDALAVAAGIDADEADDGDVSGEPAQVDDAPGGGSRSKKKLPSKTIGLPKIRTLQSFLSVGTHRGKYRIALIHPFDVVTSEAENALLKVVEEPGPATLFILVADRLDRIAPTIASRCQKVPIAIPARDAALAWLADQGVADTEAALAAAGGAPFAALESARDADQAGARSLLIGFLSRPRPDEAFVAAEALAKTGASACVAWIQQWAADCITVRSAGRIRYHPTRSAVIEALAAKASVDALWAFMQRLTVVRRSIDHPLNARLLLETLLLDYAETMGSR